MPGKCGPVLGSARLYVECLSHWSMLVFGGLLKLVCIEMQCEHCSDYMSEEDLEILYFSVVNYIFKGIYYIWNWKCTWVSYKTVIWFHKNVV